MKAALSDLRNDELARMFERVCIQQDEAMLDNNTRKYNRLFQVTIDVGVELKRRVPDGRSALITLFEHPNVQVRFQAATACLALVPERARDVIEAISKIEWMPQGPNAKEALRLIDSGAYKAT